MSTEPQRSRAVFSTEDFGLMKEAVANYVKQIADDPRSSVPAGRHSSPHGRAS